MATKNNIREKKNNSKKELSTFFQRKLKESKVNTRKHLAEQLGMELPLLNSIIRKEVPLHDIRLLYKTTIILKNSPEDTVELIRLLAC